MQGTQCDPNRIHSHALRPLVLAPETLQIARLHGRRRALDGHRHRRQCDRDVLAAQPRHAPTAGSRGRGPNRRPRLEPGWRLRLAPRPARFRAIPPGVRRHGGLDANQRLPHGAEAAGVDPKRDRFGQFLRAARNQAPHWPHIPPGRGPQAGRQSRTGDQREALARQVWRGPVHRGPDRRPQPTQLHDSGRRAGLVSRLGEPDGIRRVGSAFHDLGGPQPGHLFPDGAQRARVAGPRQAAARRERGAGAGRSDHDGCAAGQGISEQQP